jgi:hypothetical protein
LYFGISYYQRELGFKCMRREPQRRRMFETRDRRACGAVRPLEKTEIGFGTFVIHEAGKACVAGVLY